MRKTTLQVHENSATQESTRKKKQQIFENETILKIGENEHYAKAI